MSFIAKSLEFYQKTAGPLGKVDPAAKYLIDNTKAKGPPTPPGPPNPNDAANAAQAQTDAMRQRRGMLANIYAGGMVGAPQTGKTTLG